MYFPIPSRGIQKVGACLFPKQRWPAPRAFREKSTWIWRTSQGSIVTTDHIPDANVRRPTVNAIDQSIVTLVEWWRFTWKYLKNLVVYHHLSCFHMFPPFFNMLQKTPAMLAPILEVSEMCSTGWAFFCPDWSGWRIFICMILHACNM